MDCNMKFAPTGRGMSMKGLLDLTGPPESGIMQKLLNINMLTCGVGMPELHNVPVILAMSGMIPWILAFFGVALAVLVGWLERKRRETERRQQAAEKQVGELTVELSFREALYDQACAIISDVDRAARRLPEAFDEMGRILRLPYAAFVLRDSATGQVLEHQYPAARLEANQLAERILSQAGPTPEAVPEPVRLPTGWENGLTLDEGKDVFQSVTLCPIVHAGETVGGVLLALPADAIDRREKDLVRIGKIVETLFTYRTLQNELARRSEEADTVSAFLSEIAVFAALDKVMEAFHRYLQETYPNANVALLLETPDGGIEVRHGDMLEQPLILSLLPSARQELEKGKQLLYAPDAFALMKKYPLPSPPKKLQSVLVIPLVTFKHIYGYVVLESTQPQLFHAASLSTLLRLVEMGSFVLRKTLYYQGELDKLTAEINRLNQAGSRQAIQVSELEMALREATEFNTVYAVGQSIRVHLASLRGFVQMLEDGVKRSLRDAYDPLLFRNCVVEIEKVERSLQKLELTRVITDRDYPLKIQPMALMPALDSVFVAIRSKTVAKSVEIDARFDARLGQVMLDEELTLLGLRLFLDRLLDFVSGGKLQAVCLVRENAAPELMIRFNPPTGARGNKDKLVAFDVARDFHFVLLNRLIARQRGQLDFELTDAGGFLLRIVFPEGLSSAKDK